MGLRTPWKVVHALPTLTEDAAQAVFLSKSQRLVDGDVSGIPPCLIASLEFEEK